MDMEAYKALRPLPTKKQPNWSGDSKKNLAPGGYMASWCRIALRRFRR
jgi:hypothetical protein